MSYVSKIRRKVFIIVDTLSVSNTLTGGQGQRKLSSAGFYNQKEKLLIPENGAVPNGRPRVAGGGTSCLKRELFHNG